VQHLPQRYAYVFRMTGKEVTVIRDNSSMFNRERRAD
jgi:hypothetical protein